MELRAADRTDLETVLSWVTDEHQCRMWAGPNVRYPATPETAWFDMQASARNARVLVDTAAEPVGFGQVLALPGRRLHLARLIVDPGWRGQGIGRELCIALMDSGLAAHDVDRFTLNVYESNRAAVRMYRSLGFETAETDASGAVAMVQPVTGALTRTGQSAAAARQAGE